MSISRIFCIFIGYCCVMYGGSLNSTSNFLTMQFSAELWKWKVCSTGQLYSVIYYHPVNLKALTVFHTSSLTHELWRRWVRHHSSGHHQDTRHCDSLWSMGVYFHKIISDLRNLFTKSVYYYEICTIIVQIYWYIPKKSSEFSSNSSNFLILTINVCISSYKWVIRKIHLFL